MQLLRQTLRWRFFRERLEIGLGAWTLEQQLALVDRGRTDWNENRRASRPVGGRTEDLSGVSVTTVKSKRQLELLEGEFGGLESGWRGSAAVVLE